MTEESRSQEDVIDSTDAGAAHALTEHTDADHAGHTPTDDDQTDGHDRTAGERGSGSAQGGRSDGGARPLVRKEYYSISEVADLVGLPAHVLRYWESQFSVLNPSKNRSGNRVYQRKEIKLILLVKQLLHVEKYTVEGAKQRIDQLRKGGALQRETAHALDEQMVSVLREELLGLRELLAAD